MGFFNKNVPPKIQPTIVPKEDSKVMTLDDGEQEASPKLTEEPEVYEEEGTPNITTNSDEETALSEEDNELAELEARKAELLANKEAKEAAKLAPSKLADDVEDEDTSKSLEEDNQDISISQKQLVLFIREIDARLTKIESILFRNLG